MLPHSPLIPTKFLVISIHAPKRGATRVVACKTYDRRYFNPRFHEGSDCNIDLIFSFIISQSFVNYTNFFPTLQDYHTINFIFNPNTTCFSVRIPQEISVYQVFALNIFCVYFHYIFLFLQNPPYYLLYVRQTIPCGKFFSLSMYIPLEYSSCFASNNIE